MWHVARTCHIARGSSSSSSSNRCGIWLNYESAACNLQTCKIANRRRWRWLIEENCENSDRERAREIANERERDEANGIFGAEMRADRQLGQQIYNAHLGLLWGVAKQVSTLQHTHAHTTTSTTRTCHVLPRDAALSTRCSTRCRPAKSEKLHCKSKRQGRKIQIKKKKNKPNENKPQLVRCGTNNGTHARTHTLANMQQHFYHSHLIHFDFCAKWKFICIN